MNAQKLFVNEEIEIKASASKVWKALTRADLTRNWVHNFGIADGEIVSDWKMGSPVLWKGKDGETVVEGNVTALEPNKLLRFTVFDVRSKERPAVTEEDGITYRLTAKGNSTLLRIQQGDFSAMPDGAKYRDMSTEIWHRVLDKVKEVAERS